MAPPTEWQEPPETLSLPPDHMHIWTAALNLPESELRLLEKLLPPDERDRAARFHFERDRRRFIAAHGQFRTILGRYLDADPLRLEFSYGPRGKPSLAVPSEFTFNLSHSGELCLIGVAISRAIGVDVEEIRPLDDADALAKRFFSPSENVILNSLPKSDRVEAFLRCWTCKEAYVKATGDGLARPTESFDVAFREGEPLRLISVDGDPMEASRWSLVAVNPGRGYLGAAAIEGEPPLPVLFSFRYRPR